MLSDIEKVMDNESRQIYEALAEAQRSGIPVVLVTIIGTQGSMPRHAGTKMLVYADGTIIGTIGGGMLEAEVIKDSLTALKEGTPRTRSYRLNSLEAGDPGICGGSATLFIEPLGLAPTMLVIGGGHVGWALVEVGKWAGYRVVLSDDREAFCNPAYAPGLDDYLVCKPAEVVERMQITPQTYIAAVTRGLPVDQDLIPALLKTEAAYIGLIGSRRRWELTMQALESEQGITRDELTRIHAPIGLELQAETPKEIAVSILAEIIMVQRQGSGEPMQWPKPDTTAEG